jgi:hypothetical protein
MVAKLFAKHIKLSESIELCKNTRYGETVYSYHIQYVLTSLLE